MNNNNIDKTCETEISHPCHKQCCKAAPKKNGFLAFVLDACVNAAFAIGLIFSAFAIVVVGTFYGNKVYNNIYGTYRTATSDNNVTIKLTDAVYSIDKLLSK